MAGATARRLIAGLSRAASAASCEAPKRPHPPAKSAEHHQRQRLDKVQILNKDWAFGARTLPARSSSTTIAMRLGVPAATLVPAVPDGAW